MIMRRLFLSAIFALWSAAASAGINCPLPFNLQNNTTADATQVMANYNALVTCFAGAAASGANTDITSLIGLTTPLAASGGGTQWFVGGTSTGSANTQAIASLTPGGFILSSGKFVVFIAGFTNSGPTTWNANGTGAVNVTVHTAAGLASLSGGEIVAGQVTLGFYDGTQYQILDAAPPTGFVQPCTEISYQGVSVPSGYVAENGQALLRASFANLFACMSVTVAATTTSGNATIAVPNSALFQVGWFVGGNNVTCNSTITSIPGGGLSIVINNTAGGNGATTLTIGPQPQGDCSTTFNVPNMNGRESVGIDTTGGHMSATACPNPASVGSACGSLTQTILTANLPPYTPSGAFTANPFQLGNIGGADVNNSLSHGNNGNPQAGVQSINNATFTGVAQGGTSTPFLLQPVGLTLKALKT
jgi:hypothetical protein